MMKYDKFKYPVRAWLIWFLSALFMFYKYALEVSPSVMTETLMKAFSAGAVGLGNLAACYFYAYLLLQIPAGLLLDRFGPRKTTTLAIAFCALGTLGFSQTHSLWSACFARFATGIGAAFAVVNCIKLIANWFPFRFFAFMTGLMMTVAMLGAVGGQAPLSAFIEAMQWQSALKIIGLSGLALAVLFWIVVRDQSPDHRKEKHIAPKRAAFFQGLKAILTDPQSWWLSLYSGLAFAPVMVFGGLWGVSFLSRAFDLSKNLSAQMVSLIFIGFAVGAPLFGWFSSWLGRRRIVMFWGTLLSLFSISLIIYLPTLALYYLAPLLFLFGFSASSFLLCFTMICEIHTPLLAATAVGFMNAFDALLGAVSDPLTGVFLDSVWDGTFLEGARVFSVSAYKIAFTIIPIYLTLSLLALFKIQETKIKPPRPSALP